MKPIGRIAASLAVMAALGLASPLYAGTPTLIATQRGEGPNLDVRPGRLSGVEARDQRALEAAARDMNRRGYPGMARHLPALKVALDHAPTRYPIFEQTGPGRWIIRSSDLGQILIFAAGAGAATEGRRAELIQQPNVYGSIAMALGSEAVERHAYEEAIAYLDRGLAIQPENGFLSGEKASALQGLGRHEAVLTLVEAAIPRLGFGSSVEEALLLRRRGASLIELGRLDEAKAAFEASIELLPDNPVARNELEYIRQLQAGQPRQPLIIVPGPASTPTGG